MGAYSDFYRRSVDDAEAFWAEQANLIDWQTPPRQILDASRPPFANWFVGGTTNLCHNAVDRHLAARGDQPALIFVSTETGVERSYSFAELHAEVQRVAASLIELGVGQGDRVLIYMPMIPEAAFAMLACARIGAIHCVVFGGFASGSLASRIEDAEPKVVVSADAGSRGGKVLAYKPLLDEAIRLSKHKPASVLLADRGLAAMELVAGRDHLMAALARKHLNAVVPCVWLESTAISYTIYTSGTTGRPKGVQRDTGGYAVALAASMQHIFDGRAGETYFSTSDIGWVVGHSYIVYGPLIAGMATLMYEGLPTQGLDRQPDGGIWWRLVEKYKVTVMFSAPTAVRVLKKQDPALLKKYDLSSLRALFLAGEPLDEPTARWISDGLGVPIIDNYWQTESGWPIITIANGVEKKPSKFGSPGVPMYGWRVKILHESTGEELTAPNQKGVVVIEGPTPPGFMQTVWRDDARFVNTYWNSIPGRMVYSTFDWGIRDEDGYFYILGRTDDVINVAGHRLGTREIEESISGHADVAEVAVVGVADPLKGQVAMAFVVPKSGHAATDADAALKLEGEIMKRVADQLGALARPARVRFVTALPKTRSGKLLRRAIQAVCEQRDPGDLTTIDDPASLQQIRQSMTP
ncbi:propionate--CoA ligase [Variovorax sp. J22G21]|uniref:propionate--CoA ligase n=1 Tax=Variovorax fucosicus TaxID=3053517 RepID=UPI00257502AF|nr:MULTISPECIES: propionate--CoA ligase [unclassified Variovorax]MDM0041938.1 propionate--CoA ligase [Variovorax sp. J22R193]MDM0057018.1 propionate--CoA ligase [Variovorax sp. J22G47]MDM0059708.1 propionate--CoA ligase [Variovorax sp. J22G21]